MSCFEQFKCPKYKHIYQTPRCHRLINCVKPPHPTSFSSSFWYVSPLIFGLPGLSRVSNLYSFSVMFTRLLTLIVIFLTVVLHLLALHITVLAGLPVLPLLCHSPQPRFPISLPLLFSLQPFTVLNCTATFVCCCSPAYSCPFKNYVLSAFF